jgi:hypothetical protein
MGAMLISLGIIDDHIESVRAPNLHFVQLKFIRAFSLLEQRRKYQRETQDFRNNPS